LKKVYADVDDVVSMILNLIKNINKHQFIHSQDLNVGSSLEQPFSSSTLIGITYTCLLRIQVGIFRTGDRFWFETGDPSVRFTPNQLAEIRKASFSRIICDNTNSIFSVPQNPFFLTTFKNNTYVKCSDLPKVDLTFFKE